MSRDEINVELVRAVPARAARAQTSCSASRSLLCLSAHIAAGLTLLSSQHSLTASPEKLPTYFSACIFDSVHKPQLQYSSIAHVFQVALLEISGHLSTDFPPRIALASFRICSASHRHNSVLCSCFQSATSCNKAFSMSFSLLKVTLKNFVFEMSAASLSSQGSFLSCFFFLLPNSFRLIGF